MRSFFEEREWEKNTKDRVKKLDSKKASTPEFRRSLEKAKNTFIKNYSPK